jgi:signal transduction histidine kinase
MKLLDLPVETQAAKSGCSALEEARALFSHLATAESDANSVVEYAATRARALATALDGRENAEHFGVLVFAADVVAALALGREWKVPEIDEAMAELAQIVGRPTTEVKLTVFLGAIGDPRVLELPPALSIETTLRLLLAFAPVTAASFWVKDLEHGPRCVVRLGSGARRLRAAAEAAFQADGTAERPTTDAVPVRRWQHVGGALVVCPHEGQRDRAHAFVLEAGRVLGLALEREILLERGNARERSLVAASERRLARFGYDVHDGPLQDIGAARRELYMFRDDLAGALAPGAQHDAVLGRLDQLEEIVLASEIKLRELARSAECPAVLARPFRALLEAEIRALVSSCEIEVDVHLSGDLDALTGSQRIALIRIVQQALNNVREHSGASEVLLSVVRTRDRVQAEILDNGRGFEVERTLVRAGRRGRLGLIGMSERALLLGGVLDVRSRPGGPTCVSVTLPEWRPFGSSAGADHETADLDASVAWI